MSFTTIAYFTSFKVVKNILQLMWSGKSQGSSHMEDVSVDGGYY